MRLLITRPEEDAIVIAGLLRARGHMPIVAPLMDVQVREGAAVTLDGVQALLATSANGVRAFAQRTSAPRSAALCRRTADGGNRAQRRVQDRAECRGQFERAGRVRGRACRSDEGTAASCRGIRDGGTGPAGSSGKGIHGRDHGALRRGAGGEASRERARGSPGRDARRRAAVFSEERQDLRHARSRRQSSPRPATSSMPTASAPPRPWRSRR